MEQESKKRWIGKDAQVTHEQSDGISSQQKTSGLVLAGFGGIFLVFGGVISLSILPDAFRTGQYGALFALLFPLVGAAIVYHGYVIHRDYKKIGSTPLLLDPATPGVGGQLGGRFNINLPSGSNSSTADLKATLSCTRTSKSGDSTSRMIQWQKQMPVYLKETAEGVEGAFIFDIPDDCSQTREWSNRSSIDWDVTVEGEFSDQSVGKFKRSWVVIVKDNAVQSSNILNIPQSFLDSAKREAEEQAKMSGMEQIAVDEDTDYINVTTKAGRNVSDLKFIMVFGVFFSGGGIFAAIKQEWIGYIFLAIGLAALIISIYKLGKSIEVKVDKIYGNWCFGECANSSIAQQQQRARLNL